MMNIAIVALPNCHASGVHGVMDFFTVANYCARVPGVRSDPLFNCQVVTVDNQPVRGYSGALVTPTVCRESFRPDLIVVGSSIEAAVSAELLERTLAPAIPLYGWLREAFEQGVVVASVCTGSFVLAEAGLLGDQVATTHWRAAPLFRGRYPDIRLDEDQLLVDNGQIICAGGATAFVDLCLYLVERFASPSVALACSKMLVLDGRRVEQTPYMAFYSRKAHQDDAIRKAQTWLEHHYSDPVSIDDVADVAGLGTRTFKRRFKEATGETPIGYLQHLRIEAAKHKLESSREQTARIIWSVGYEDASSFRRLFKRTVGCTMEQYRKRFSYVTPMAV
ncbi:MULTISPECIES: GlxA family transcriptional regulator [unclassified Marinobacter]|uniref:GlxA family transcriptional regulator n=1 Tax=unclassified Marinobacter TaxID=83889 RepID=UPI0019256146|nr:MULTISPECIES: helix-turn-helix domain-containing protein [unclassified Marinobacter]MBL3823470.1 helix-turn-helix domain-containing protein [Marinobacter sp. MC3]MBL3892199.1 helix-turn-helix domain-containing protein [Marinobacter sp. MW3]